MWAVGCVVYWLLCGFTPFRASTIPKVLWNIEKGSFRWPRGVQLSDDVKSLIQSLLKRDPGERPSAKQLLNHPWVKGGPLSAKTLLGAGKKLLQGSAAQASAIDLQKPEGVGVQARGDSPLVQQLIADARPTAEALPWPESRDLLAKVPLSAPASPEKENRARAAALTNLPTNLSIRTQKPQQPISLGFAAGPAVAAAQDLEEAAVLLTGSGDLGSEDPDHAFWEEGAVLQLASYDEPASPFADAKDPLDSCMSYHEDRSFQTARTANADSLPTKLDLPFTHSGVLTPSSLWQPPENREDNHLDRLASCTSTEISLDPLSRQPSSSQPLRRTCTDSFAEMDFEKFAGRLEAAREGSRSQDNLSSDTPPVPLVDRLPAPSEHLQFHELHQLVIRRKALQALVKAQRENQLPEIVDNARQFLVKHKSA